MTALKVWTGTYVMLRTLKEQKPSKKNVLPPRRDDTVAYIRGCTLGIDKLCPKLGLLRRMGTVQ